MSTEPITPTGYLPTRLLVRKGEPLVEARARVVWTPKDSELESWGSPVTVAEIEAAAGTVPDPFGTTFHGGTDEFLRFLESEPSLTADD